MRHPSIIAYDCVRIRESAFYCCPSTNCPHTALASHTDIIYKVTIIFFYALLLKICSPHSITQSNFSGIWTKDFPKNVTFKKKRWSVKIILSLKENEVASWFCRIFTVAFLLFLAPAGGSYPGGQPLTFT